MPLQAVNNEPVLKTIILVPGWSKDKMVYQLYEVDVQALSSVLPASSELKTENFYAAQTFISGYAKGQKV